MTEREARLAAQREFGNMGVYREEIRDTWRPPQLADLWRTLRFALRSLRRSPGFALLAIITLALGIGGNTMMFSAFTSIMQKPLPYPGGGGAGALLSCHAPGRIRQLFPSALS
jgi:hypothetical protein